MRIYKYISHKKISVNGHIQSYIHAYELYTIIYEHILIAYEYIYFVDGCLYENTSKEKVITYDFLFCILNYFCYNMGLYYLYCMRVIFFGI